MICAAEVRMAGDEGDHGALHDVLAQQPQAAVVGHGELVASVARAIPASSLRVIFFYFGSFSLINIQEINLVKYF
jgi:hypothetical protein